MHQFRYIVHTALLLLHPIVAMQQVEGNFLKEQIPHPPQSASDTTRKLQQSPFIYRANYTADFHHILDPSCSGDVPVLVVACLQAQNMTILKTSNESIICNPENIDFAGFTDALSYRCFNTCNGTSCNDIFISNFIDGPYGSIQFMCEGNDYQEMEAAYIYIGGDNGSCNATSNSTLSRNLHIARLGISCPSETVSGDGGATRQYVYDDSYFECSFTGSTNAFASSLDPTNDPSDLYTCLTGGNCGGNACSDIIFNDIVIRSAVPQFLHQCVETTLQSITTIPSQSPIVPADSDTIYNVRFEALWGNFYDSPTALAKCQYDNTEIQISCGNGATAIRFHNSTDSAMICTNVNDIELQCIGDETEIRSLFTSVMYDCYGGNVSTSLVTFPETNVSCDNNNVTVLLKNSVIMGLSCEGEPTLYYSDLLFECPNPSSQFYVSASGDFNLVGDRFICSESTMITSGSSALDVQIIPSVSITTDSLWAIDTLLQRQCSKIVDSIPTYMPSVAPSPAPTIIPAVTPPIPSIIAPIGPTLDNSVPPDTTGVNSSTIFAIVGGIAGGIVISSIIFFVYRKGKNDGSTKKYYDNPTGSHASTNPLTQFNSDHLTRFSNTTNKHSSQTAASQTDTSASDVHSHGLLSTTPEPVIESNAYIIDYKDQARSVDHRFPVMNSARRVATDDVPIATAIAVSDITDDANKSSVIKFRDLPSDVSTRFDV